jgi:hypothetical protein
VRKWAPRLGAKVIESDTNRGLAKSIVSGVTELCERYGRVIVLEDNFALSPDFLRYMKTALDGYENEPNVYQVAGYMFPVEHPREPDAFFMPMTSTWGWATWQRAWKIFDWSATGWEEMRRNTRERKRFDLDGTYPYSAMLEKRLAGENDSWSIPRWLGGVQGTRPGVAPEGVAGVERRV